MRPEHRLASSSWPTSAATPGAGNSPFRWFTRWYCSGHFGSRVFYAVTRPSNSPKICLPINRAVAASPKSRAAR